MKKKIMALIFFIIVILFSSTFIEKSDTYKEPDNDLIVMSVSNFNLDLDKVTNLDKDDENIICATCRGLVKANNNHEVVMDLAEEIDISEDGIEYNFKLRDDIYWSNGEKIKAEDVISYFKSLIKIEDEENISALLDIYGMKNFKLGIGTFEKDVAITSEENNIKIRLNKRNDNFLLELSKPQYRIRKKLALWGDLLNNYKNIVYSGDYSIGSIEQEKIELKNNLDESYSKKLLLCKDDSREDAVASYEIGDRDIVINPPISQLNRLDEKGRVISSPAGEGIYLAINTENEELNSDVRKKFMRLLYSYTQIYCEDNKKAVKFSEGSYFQKEMDELDKLQSRKVSMNTVECDLPGKIDVYIGDDEIIEDYFQYISKCFFENEDINIIIFSKDNPKEKNDYDIIVTRLTEDVTNKNQLYSDMKELFSKENEKYFNGTSNLEESLFNSCSIVPIMFINENIIISNKVANIRMDGNGNIDFSNISQIKGS